MNIEEMNKKYCELKFVHLGELVMPCNDYFAWYSFYFQRFFKFNESEIWFNITDFEHDFWAENDKQKRKYPEYALDNPDEFLDYLKFLMYEWKYPIEEHYVFLTIDGICQAMPVRILMDGCWDSNPQNEGRVFQ